MESEYVATRRLLSRDQVAECLGMSVSTVVRLEQRGALPHVKLGRLVRFRPGDVEALIDRASAGTLENDTTPPTNGAVPTSSPMVAGGDDQA